jgi:hypothetical protein
MRIAAAASLRWTFGSKWFLLSAWKPLWWWMAVVVDYIFPRWRLPDYFLIKAKLSEVL